METTEEYECSYQVSMETSLIYIKKQSCGGVYLKF